MITSGEWQSIHTAIQRSAKVPPIKHSKVTKRDKTERKVWLHDYGDDSVPMAAFEYEISFYDEESGTIQQATLLPKIPDVGDTVLVNEAMASRGLARITGVVPKKKKHHKNYIFAAKAPEAPAAPVAFTLPVGSLIAWGGDTQSIMTGEQVVDPVGKFLLCNGAAISRTTYADLFTAIYIKFGSGDGTTTFNLPDLKGKVAVGQDTSQSEFNVTGELGGAKTHTLTEAQLAAHDHAVDGSIDSGGAHTHSLTSGAGAISYVLGTGPSGNDKAVTAAGSFFQILNTVGTTTDGLHAHSHTLGTTDSGSGSAHNNLQPYQVVGGWLIKF